LKKVERFRQKVVQRCSGVDRGKRTNEGERKRGNAVSSGQRHKPERHTEKASQERGE